MSTTSVLMVINWGGWVRQRCCISCVTGASNWYWLTVGQGLLSLQQVWVEGECFLIFLFLNFHLFSSFAPVPLFHPFYCLFYLFSFSLGDGTKWPTWVDVSLNPNTINQNDDWHNQVSQRDKLKIIHCFKLAIWSSYEHYPHVACSLTWSYHSDDKTCILPNYWDACKWYVFSDMTL